MGYYGIGRRIPYCTTVRDDDDIATSPQRIYQNCSYITYYTYLLTFNTKLSYGIVGKKRVTMLVRVPLRSSNLLSKSSLASRDVKSKTAYPTSVSTQVVIAPDIHKTPGSIHSGEERWQPRRKDAYSGSQRA